ncbi:MAG: GNAT family N-acetyltransferase [Microlunatus sp.]|nr:GNAT family N-acetyltransferase [Microlunatus sp.]
MREEASAWLESKGIDQWRNPWPTADAQEQRISASIAAGETWMITDDGTDVATVALDDFADPQLWTPDERRQPALYLHRLIVRRTHPGLGAHILDWASAKAAAEGRNWVRIDVWTGNLALQRYYQRHGFRHVRTVQSDYPSGALFQRPASAEDARAVDATWLHAATA